MRLPTTAGPGRTGALLGLAAPARAQSDEPGCRPEMASLRLPIQRADLTLANLAKDEVRLTFVGHATFTIETPGGITAATDYNDYVRPHGTPDIATMNKAHSSHNSRNPDPAIKQVLPGWDPTGAGAAKHDVTLGDMRVRNVPTNIRSYSGSTDFDGNSMFVFEIGELCVAHLGHLHHPLEPGHLRALGRVDVVLFPVDGSYTLDQSGMIEVLKMPAGPGDDPDAFLRRLEPRALPRAASTGNGRRSAGRIR